MKLKKGDNVKIVLGKDKGKVAKIEKIYPKLHKVLAEGVNQYKRHFKSRVQNQKSEIITITKPLPVSAVALVCPKCNKVTRIGFEIIKGKKGRICKICRKSI